MGNSETYKDNSPDGYKEHVVWEPPPTQSTEEEKEALRQEIYETGLKDSKEAQHQHPKWNLQIQNKDVPLFEEDPEKVNKVYTGSKIDRENWKKWAWSDEQMKHINEKEWLKETKNPSGYQVTPYDKDNLQIKHGKKLAARGDDKPIVAWDDRHAINSNDEEFWEETKHPKIPYHKLIPDDKTSFAQ